MRMNKARYDVFNDLARDNNVRLTSDKAPRFWDAIVEHGWLKYLSGTCVTTPAGVAIYSFDGHIMLLRNIGRGAYGKHNVEYMFVTPDNRTLFAGKDYSHAFRDAIGQEAAYTLLAMLCDNPDESGGTFDHYTPAQKAFGRSDTARELEFYSEGY